MNTKSLTAALILSLAALSSAHAADAPRADRIVDLPTVTVRPDAALRAELAANATQAPHIVEPAPRKEISAPNSFFSAALSFRGL